MSSNTRSTSDAQQQTVLTIDPIIYEQPTILMHSEEPIPYIDDELKLIIYSRARLVKWIALIDMIFLTFSLVLSVLNNTLLWIYLALFFFCICGYNGAMKYKKYQLMIYDFYLVAMTIFYFYIALYSNNFFWFIFAFIEFYFSYYTSRLIYYMNSVSEDIIESLQNGWNPIGIAYYYY